MKICGIVKKKKNRVNSLKGIINIVIEHQGNASFVTNVLGGVLS